jgi:hypothetical protein
VDVKDEKFRTGHGTDAYYSVVGTLNLCCGGFVVRNAELRLGCNDDSGQHPYKNYIKLPQRTEVGDDDKYEIFCCEEGSKLPLTPDSKLPLTANAGVRGGATPQKTFRMETCLSLCPGFWEFTKPCPAHKRGEHPVGTFCLNPNNRFE